MKKKLFDPAMDVYNCEICGFPCINESKDFEGYGKICSDCCSFFSRFPQKIGKYKYAICEECNELINIYAIEKKSIATVLCKNHIILPKINNLYQKKVQEKTCIYCGKEFISTKKDRRFCCIECLVKYNRENNVDPFLNPRL